MLGQLFLVGGSDGNAIKNSVYSHICEALLLTQGDTKLIEGFEQLRIHLIEAGLLIALLGSRVINNILKINLRIAKGGPIGHLHPQPLAIGAQSEFEQKGRFVLFARNQAHHILTEALGDFFGFDVSHEPVLIRLTDEITNAGCRGHGLLSKGAMGLNLFD